MSIEFRHSLHVLATLTEDPVFFFFSSETGFLCITLLSYNLIYRLSWLEIYLPLPPECWAESNVLPHQAWQVLVTPKAATSVFQLF